MFNLTDVNATQVTGDVIEYVTFDGYDVLQTVNDMNDALKRNSFHFVILYDGQYSGSIPATYYNESEVDDIANLKKTLASCFQSRLNQSTGVVNEVDPQSTHRSNYIFHSQGKNV